MDARDLRTCSMIYGEIPKLGATLNLSDKDRQSLDEMIKKPLQANKKLADKIMESIYADAKAELDAFYKAIDVQCKSVLKQAQADGIIKGRISKAKVTAAGYDTCFQDGVGAYIRRNGVRVSEIIKHPAV